MTDDQQLTLWVGACRYYMGRRTYAVSNFCEMLRAQWATLPEPTQKIIRRDAVATKRSPGAPSTVR